MLLALRALNLGDLLVAVPALRALRRRYPGHRLVLAAGAHLAPVVERIGAVDELLAHRGLTPPPVARPDVAVDLHGVLPDSVAALQATAPGRLIAFRAPAVGHLDGPDADPREHEVARWCRLVASDGAEPDPADLLLPPPPPPAGHAGATIVHVGSRYGSKRWPVERYAQVARSLAGQGHEVVFTGSARECPRAARAARLAGLTASSVLAGTTDLPALMALVAHARLVVTGDTGPAHLATAFARPSVVLFGPASPRLWGPPPRPWHAALWHGTGERPVLTDEPDPALLLIEPAEVLAAARRVLGEASP